MKKFLTIGLVVVLVLGLGMFSFAQYNNQRMAFGSNQGFGPSMMNGGNYGNGSTFGPGMMNSGYAIDNTVVESLSELTGLTTEEIYQSGLPLYVIAEENDVLDDFLEVSLNNRIERIEALVENGSITEAYGELMISQMTEMHEYQSSEGFVDGGTFYNNHMNFRGNGFCGGRW